MAAPLPPWVARYVGIPYVACEGVCRCGHQGADCWGLLTLIWREVFRLDLPDYSGPHWKKGANAADIGAAIAAEVERYQPIDPGHEQLGDGIILRLRGHPLHVGLVVAPGWMIHTHESAGACVEDYHRMAWARRVIGFRRYVPAETRS